MGYSGFEIETPPTIADPHLRSLYQYWRELARDARGLPSVQRFDPLHLPRVLPNIWILEVEPETRRFRMRLAGENINAVYRRNIGGHYFADIFEPSDLNSIVTRYTRALTEPAIFYATGSVYVAGGSLSLGERLGLPMLGRSGVTSTLLGATVHGGSLRRDGDVLITGDMPAFFPVRAANHKAPEIVGP